MTEIRRVHGAERLDTLGPLETYAFAASPRVDDAEEQRRALAYHDQTHSLVGFDDGRPVCAGSAIAMTQNVRGRVVPAAAIAGVATHPEARRQGWVRRLLTRLLTERHEAGDVLSVLYPFRESFYQRLGYAGLPQVKALTVRPDQMGPLLARDLDGRVRLASIADGFDAYRDLLRRAQRGTHGMLLRNAASAQRLRDQNQWWVALAETETETGDGTGNVTGDVVGAMTYQLTGHGGRLHARDLVSVSPVGRYLVLRWLARHVDQVDSAHLLVAPGERPESWQADLLATVGTRDDGVSTPMGRVLSVSGLAGIDAGDGQFVARVTDPVLPWNTGEYRFSGQDGVLAVEPVPAGTAEWELPVQGLSALVYTGHDPLDLPFRGWGEPPSTQHAAIRAVFGPTLPYLHEEF